MQPIKKSIQLKHIYMVLYVTNKSEAHSVRLHDNSITSKA